MARKLKRGRSQDTGMAKSASPRTVRQSVQRVSALGRLSLHGALQRTDPFCVADRLSEESRSDHGREEDLGLLIGRLTVRRAPPPHVVEKLPVQSFRSLPVGPT